MQNLQTTYDIPLKINTNGEVEFEEDVLCKEKKKVSITDISSYLLNKSLKYPESVYSYHQGISLKTDLENAKQQDEKFSYDIVEIPYGLLGIEFVKTHIYFGDPSKASVHCMVEVIAGELTVMVQHTGENEKYNSTIVDRVDGIVLTAGEKMAIPTGVFYTFINTGNTTLVFSRLSLVEAETMGKINTETKGRGLACFVISKNAKVEIVKNPKYKPTSKVRFGKLREMDEDIRMSYVNKVLEELDANSLYSLYKNNLDKLDTYFAFNG